ncbi:MAG: hypothetical protein MI920_00455, partial [Kiloniellales bacterium]|nr:hypothetical protein [Kiloniellales bacterium]
GRQARRESPHALEDTAPVELSLCHCRFRHGVATPCSFTVGSCDFTLGVGSLVAVLPIPEMLGPRVRANQHNIVNEAMPIRGR